MIQKNLQKIAMSCGVALALSLATQVSHAGNAIGITYSSGFGDVADWYDENVPYLDVQGIPIGISYRYIHDFESAMRLDIGVSYFGVWGDISYDDLPLQVTVGYNFLPGSTFKPYVRGGLSYHFMDGDYVEEEAGAGFIGALGVEIGKKGNFFAEVSMDTAEATFTNSYGQSEEIAVSDTMLTIGGRW